MSKDIEELQLKLGPAFMVLKTNKHYVEVHVRQGATGKYSKETRLAQINQYTSKIEISSAWLDKNLKTKALLEYFAVRKKTSGFKWIEYVIMRRNKDGYLRKDAKLLQGDDVSEDDLYTFDDTKAVKVHTEVEGLAIVRELKLTNTKTVEAE